MTKIAPTLHDYVMRPDAPGTSLLDRATLRAMQSELRALKAVAAIAKRIDVACDYPDTANNHEPCGVCWPCRMRRASARLRSAGRGSK